MLLNADESAPASCQVFGKCSGVGKGKRLKARLHCGSTLFFLFGLPSPDYSNPTTKFHAISLLFLSLVPKLRNQ